MSQYEEAAFRGRVFSTAQTAQINFPNDQTYSPFAFLNPPGSGMNCAILKGSAGFSSQQQAGLNLPGGLIGVFGTTSTGLNAVTNGLPSPPICNRIGNDVGETAKGQVFFASNPFYPVIQAPSFLLCTLAVVNGESNNTATQPSILSNDFAGQYVVGPGACIFFAFFPQLPPPPNPTWFLAFGLTWEETPVQVPCAESPALSFVS
jgi:hypothetical protein